MSDSESLSSINEGSYNSYEYEMEDETCETISKHAFEGEPSYVVEPEFIDSMPDAYIDEPLADESWIEEYERNQEIHNREIEELALRLNGQDPVSSWCNCGCCDTHHLVEAKECRCCTEVSKCVEILADKDIFDVRLQSGSMCITNHPGFAAVCLNRWSLELSADHFKKRSGQKYRQLDSKDRFLRVVAYRQFTRLVHGHLKEKRIPLPACAYHAIRTAFKESDDDFIGYEDLENEEEN